MKKIRFKIILLAAVILISAGTSSFAAAVGSSAPGFTLEDGSGRRVSLEDFRGRLVFLDFWASWCPPCKKEMPELKVLMERFGPNNLAVLAVSVDKKKSHADAFLSTLGGVPEGMVVLYDPGAEVVSSYNALAMPTSFIIDRAGVVRYLHYGYREDDPGKWVEELESLLAEDPR